MNIEVDDIYRYFLIVKSTCKIQNIIVGEIAPATLLVTQTPHRWHWHTTGKPCIIFNYSRDAFSTNKVIIHFASVGTKT